MQTQKELDCLLLTTVEKTTLGYVNCWADPVFPILCYVIFQHLMMNAYNHSEI